MEKYIFNKCDDSGNIITGHQEEVEIIDQDDMDAAIGDYKAFHEIADDKNVDIVKVDWD